MRVEIFKGIEYLGCEQLMFNGGSSFPVGYATTLTQLNITDIVTGLNFENDRTIIV